jgi:hypothetical protein
MDAELERAYRAWREELERDLEKFLRGVHRELEQSYGEAQPVNAKARKHIGDELGALRKALAHEYEVLRHRLREGLGPSLRK